MSEIRAEVQRHIGQSVIITLKSGVRLAGEILRVSDGVASLSSGAVIDSNEVAAIEKAAAAEAVAPEAAAPAAEVA